MSIVSENIKFLRKTNGFTQEQFASQIGIKRSLLGAYEEGRANPNLGNLMNIAKIFGMAVDELLQDDLRKKGEAPVAISSAATVEPIRPAEKKPISNAVRTPSIPAKVTAPNPAHYPNSQPITPKTIPSLKEQLLATTIAPTPTMSNGNASHTHHAKSTATEPPLLESYRTPATPLAGGPISSVVPLVKSDQAAAYVVHHTQQNFLQQLPALHLPVLPTGSYRAFEVGDDFAFPGALVVGQQVRNLYDIVDGKSYLLVLQQKGIVYRRVYSQMRIKGTLLLTSDKATVPSLEIAAKEVLEVWEAKAFFSMQLPEPTVSLDRLSQLLAEMQQELDRLKK